MLCLTKTKTLSEGDFHFGGLLPSQLSSSFGISDLIDIGEDF